MSSQKINELITLIAKLRAPDGCPWDQKQTPESFKPYLLEETHELAEAIDSGNMDHIKEELGDLFFQTNFLGTLYEEAGHFTIDECIQGIIEKMTRRHPHVFTDEKFESEEAIRHNWQKIKASEKKKEQHDIIDLPKSLPALTRAQRISGRIASQGFEWSSDEQLMNKLGEEIEELQQAVKENNDEHMQEEIGDVLIMLINLCRRKGFYTEDLMHSSMDKFIERFTTMTKLIDNAENKLVDLSDEEKVACWREAKKSAKAGTTENNI